MKTLLLAAATAAGLDMTSAFAATGNPPPSSGYVYPKFWADQTSQQDHGPVARVANEGGDATIHAYFTHSEHGTWLYPPNPFGGD